MDRITATILSMVIAALFTYFGGNVFFDSSLPVAVALKASLITMYVRWAVFVMFGSICYVALTWASAVLSRPPRPAQK